MKYFKHTEHGSKLAVEDFAAEAMERFGFVEITKEEFDEGMTKKK